MDPTEGGDIAAAVTRPAQPQPPLHTTHHCSQQQQQQQDNDREAEDDEGMVVEKEEEGGEGDEKKEREAEEEGEEGEGEGEDDEDPDGATAGKDEPAGIEIGRFFRYKWLPSRRARQTTIQKMEMQQLQRRFEAREMADIMRSRANASSRRRRRQRSSAATASSSSSGSSPSSSSSSSADEGESGSSSTSSSSSDDDDDNSDSSSSPSSSSSSRTASATARSRRRKSSRESRMKRKREAQTDEGDGEEEEEEEGEQATTKATKGKAVALSTRRRREPSGDGGDQSPRGDSKDPDSSAKPDDKSDMKEKKEKEKKKKEKKKEKKVKKEKKKDKKEKKEKKRDKKEKKDKERKDKKKKKKRRKSGGEEADSASEKRSKTSSSKGATTAYVPFATTTKCAKCNTYNCLRACTKAMCSRCCPLDGEPCRAHADRSRRTALSSASRGTKRTSEGGATSQSRDDGGEADDDDEEKRQQKKKKAKVEHADAEAVAESINTANNSIVANSINNNEQPGPTSSPHLKEGEAARRVRRRASSQPQAQQHRKCALCHANNYLRLCPKAMCRVCCPKDGPMCSPHALKEALKAPATATPGPDAVLRPKPEGGSGLGGAGGGTAAGGASSPQLPPHPEEELAGAVASSPPLAATPSPSLPSSFAHPSPTVIVTRAGDGSERGDEAQQTARSTSLSAPAPPSPSGGEEEEDAGEAEEEEESSTNALAFFLKNAAASRSASPALDSTSDALSPSASSLDSILAALPSAAPPYALDLGGDPAQLLGVKRKHPTRCVQCNSNNALGACPKSCCSICCPKDGQRCPAHSHKRGSSSSTSTSSAPSSLRPPPAKRRNLATDAPHSPSESSASAYAFNDAGESEILATRRVLRSEDVARPAPAAAGTQSVYRTLKCVHCNSYNMLHSCALQMCSICCHKSGEVPGALPDHHSSGASTTPAAGSSLVVGSAPLGGSPELSSSDERKPKPRGRPKGSTKKKKLEDLARLMREHGQGDGNSVSSSSLSTAAAVGEGAFQPFLYPAPSLPPPPLGRRAPTRSVEASSRRAKQNTLARMRQQQWQDDLEDDDDDEDDEDDNDDDVEEDDDDEGQRSNGHVHTLPSDEDDDDDHYDDEEEEEEEDYEDDDERYDEGGAIRANGAGTTLQLSQPPPPKRPRGRPRKLKPTPEAAAAAPPLPHDLVAMTLSTFHHASDLAEGQGQQAAAADYHTRGDNNDQWKTTTSRSDEPGRGRADAERVAAAAAAAKTEPSSDEESAGGLTHSQQEREWGAGDDDGDDVPTSVEEVLVDDLLFLVCGRDHRADFVRGMAEPTFLYAPKKGAAHYARRPKRQSIRSPSGASCSNCSKPKSTSWREGWIPRGSTSPIMLCHGCGTRYGKEMFCTYCHYIYMADEDWNTTKWIGCDSCTKWIHKKCEEIHIGRVIDVKAYYQCPTCRGEIIEPPPIGAPPVAHDETETLSD